MVTKRNKNINTNNNSYHLHYYCDLTELIEGK